MSESFSAAGLRVHTPFGPRKSGMPESVEIPAPVSTTTCSAAPSQVRTCATPSSTYLSLLSGRAHPDADQRELLDGRAPDDEHLSPRGRGLEDRPSACRPD